MIFDHSFVNLRYLCLLLTYCIFFGSTVFNAF